MGNFSTKLASTVSAVAIAASAMSVSLVSAASEFLPYAEALVANKVIGPQSTEAGFRLNDQITRAELAKVAANLGQYTKVSCTGKVFADVNSSLGDLCDAIETLAAAGVVNSKATNFRPTANVTRAEMTKMLLGALGEKPSEVSAGYADVTASLGDLAGFINRANELKCANTAMYFRPQANSSRGEAFKIASCTAKLSVNPTKPTEEKKEEVQQGNVTLSLVGSASASYVPYNASSIKVGTVKVTATGGDVTVTSLVIAKSGLGLTNGIDSVQLASNGIALTDARGVSSSSQTATPRFNTPLMLKKGQSIDLDVLVSLKDEVTNANSQYQFAVAGINVANVTTNVSPITLGLINTTSYGVGTATVSAPTAGSITAGKAAQTITNVTISANRDATINGFALTRNSGEEFTKALANVKAYYNGKEIGTVAVTSDKITVSGLDISRLSGESAQIQLRADGIYVGNASEIKFSVESSTDVSATEKSTGYIMRVAGTKTAEAKLTLGALDIRLEKTTTGSLTVAPGTSNVELFNGVIRSDAAFDISKYTLTVTGALNNFADGKVTLYIDGIDYEVKSESTTFSRSGDAFRVEPGTPVKVRVVGNVLSTASVPTDYQVTLTLDSAKNLSNGQTTNLNKVLVGDKVKVSNGTYTIQKATNSDSAKTRQESTDAQVTYFNLRAVAEDQTLQTVTVKSATGGTFDSYASAIALYQGDNQVAYTSSSTDLASDTFTFENLNVNVAKDVNLPFTVRVSLKSGEVTQLGKTIAVDVTGVKMVRSVDTTKETTTNSTLPVKGNEYQIAARADLSVNLTAQEGKNTTVQFTNNTSYNVVIESIEFDVTRNAVNGNYLQWAGTQVKFLESINGNGTTVDVATPGKVTIENINTNLGNGTTLDRIIEIVDDKNTMNDADYTVTVRSVKYHYEDTNDSSKVSPAITQSYNVAK